MNNVEFGLHLRELRRKKGLTLQELGALADLSQPYLSQIENGKRAIPSPEILHKLAKHLDVSHVHLMIKAGHLPGKENEYLESPYESELRKKEDDEIRKEFKEIEHKHNDLVNVIYRPEIHFKGKPLTSEERKKLVDMIYILLGDKGI